MLAAAYAAIATGGVIIESMPKYMTNMCAASASRELDERGREQRRGEDVDADRGHAMPRMMLMAAVRTRRRNRLSPERAISCSVSPRRCPRRSARRPRAGGGTDQHDVERGEAGVEHRAAELA